MTEGMARHLKLTLEEAELPITGATGNSEAKGPPVPPTEAEIHAGYRTRVRKLLSIVRVLVLDAEKHATPDNTLVPAPPPEPDRWGWVPTAVKGGFVGGMLVLHLLETILIVWLTIAVVTQR